MKWFTLAFAKGPRFVEAADVRTIARLQPLKVFSARSVLKF
jgi:hypothetical protein